MEPAEFAQMVQACKQAANAIGSVQYGPQSSESVSLRRSIYLAKDVTEGQMLDTEHLTTARPALGMPCRMMPDLLGRVMRQDARAGMPLTMEMVR
jgi:sialic acid synthase SpsE